MKEKNSPSTFVVHFSCIKGITLEDTKDKKKYSINEALFRCQMTFIWGCAMIVWIVSFCFFELKDQGLYDLLYFLSVWSILDIISNFVLYSVFRGKTDDWVKAHTILSESDVIKGDSVYQNFDRE